MPALKGYRIAHSAFVASAHAPASVRSRSMGDPPQVATTTLSRPAARTDDGGEAYTVTVAAAAAAALAAHEPRPPIDIPVSSSTSSAAMIVHRTINNVS